MRLASSPGPTNIIHENIIPGLILSGTSRRESHFPTGAGNRWGLRGAGRGLASVAGCHGRTMGSSSAQLLMPCCPPSHSSRLAESQICATAPPPLALGIPHFPLWVHTADSCQDPADPPTTYLHVFNKSAGSQERLLPVSLLYSHRKQS